MEKKKPEIRFNGFEGEWVKDNAVYIFETYYDKNHPNLPVLSASQELGMVIRDNVGFQVQHKKENEVGYKRVLPGQFVIHLRSFQGGFAHSMVEGITSPAYTVMQFKNSSTQDDIYWKYVLTSKTFIKRLETVTYGIRDGRSISFEDFSELNFTFPSLSEQEKIGLFLTTLDKLIAKLEAKLDKLRKLKQALLEKMFTNVNRGGYETPEIRFKGYTDKWEVKELGELAIFNPPNQPLKELFYYIDLESVEKGFLKIKEQVTKRMAPSRAQRTLEFNDILFQTVRPYLQNHYLFKKNTQNNQWVASTGYALLRPKIYPELLYTMLLSEGFMQEVMQRCTGSTYPAINSKKMTDIKVGCSSVQMEQQLIGDLFILLDNQLNKTSTKLTKLRNIKQSLLQKMFV